MQALHRAVAVLVLLGNLAVLASVGVGTARRAPGWVARHYAPVKAAPRCDAVVTRLRAAVRQAGLSEPSEAQEALLEALRVGGDCADGSAAVTTATVALGLEPAR